jgi:hypothetical protein
MKRFTSKLRQLNARPAPSQLKRLGARFRPLLEPLERRDLLTLVINPTFDPTITNDPSAATIEATINRAIAAYESSISDNITVNITFKEVTTGLGASNGVSYTPTYQTYYNALVSHANGANDTTALASIPNQANDPINNQSTITVREPLAKALGLNITTTASDGTISLNTSICNLDRTSVQDPTKYDLQAVTSHEIDEILGGGSALDGQINGNAAPTGPIEPLDLFRYSAAGTRSFDTLQATTSYFSIDGGTTNLVGYNQYAPDAAHKNDFGDWFSNNGAGATTPRVQDSNSTSGATPNLGVELTRLDVLGFTLSPLNPPVVTAAAHQLAMEGAPKPIDLGSFTDPDAAPWGITVSWGDGSPNTSFFVNTPGNLGSQTHNFAEEGTYTVTVTVSDFTSQVGSKTFTVDVSDPAVLPTGNFSFAAVEGALSATQTVATFTDPGGAEANDGTHYSATIDWGDATAATTGTITFSSGVFSVQGAHTYAEEGSYTITVTINHEATTAVLATSSATVSDLAVLPTGNFSFAAIEGALSATQTVATFTDPGGAEANDGTHYSATIDWGDATPTTSGAIGFSAGVFTVQGAHTYGEEGNFTITVTIHHETAPDASTTSTATVSDPAVLPTGGFMLVAARGAPLCDVTVATFTDPGGAEPNLSDPAGTIADHYSATIDWGDLTAPSAGEITFSGSPGSKTDLFGVLGDHIYATNGTFTITVTIHHETAPDAVTTSTATVSAVAIGQGPCDPNTLLIGGTLGDDTIRVVPQGNKGDVSVLINGQSAGTFAGSSFSSIAIYGQAGNDDLEVADSIVRTVFLYGGDGNDRLKGGGGLSVLLGGNGDDTLIGGSGRSILIGGAGSDKLNGGSGDDLLIGDATIFDDPANCGNNPQLCLLESAWGDPTKSYSARVLAVDAILAGNVFNDGAADVIQGASGMDLFYMSLGDVIHGNTNGQVIKVI